MDRREHVVELLSIGRAVPFEYHHDDRTFLFDTEEVSPDDIAHYGYPHSVEGITTEDVQRWEVSHSFLMARYPVSTAIGREAIEAVWSSALKSETHEIMADVLAEQAGAVKMAERNEWLGRTSFGGMKLIMVKFLCRLSEFALVWVWTTPYMNHGANTALASIHIIISKTVNNARQYLLVLAILPIRQTVTSTAQVNLLQ